jgi:hypothetical protein
MDITFRSKAILVVVGCFVVFALNALWLRSLDHVALHSLAWYQSYVTYRMLLLQPVILLPFGLFLIICLVKLYKNQYKKPVNERQQLYLLALICGTVLGVILVAVFKP